MSEIVIRKAVAADSARIVQLNETQVHYTRKTI